ncbi:hypothetical protein PISMIDRAFT_20393 [Pisolithus microcarpus 441]|uniref:Uncharacterized protein n=1 Tax=Pisolithus microcarpus 441 TaxID=765257 RepID=A0A0C9YJC5_9AGAM|nr:hypothetical protein PISMIDRAFT_20393 [Pisolithus microcarpus 441]
MPTVYGSLTDSAGAREAVWGSVAVLLAAAGIGDSSGAYRDRDADVTSIGGGLPMGLDVMWSRE